MFNDEREPQDSTGAQAHPDDEGVEILTDESDGEIIVAEEDDGAELLTDGGVDMGDGPDSADLKRLVIIAEAIEDAGGELRAADVRERETTSPIGSMLGGYSSETTLELTVAVGDVPVEEFDGDEDTEPVGIALDEAPADDVAEEGESA